MQESLNAIPAHVAPIETKSFARQVKIDFFSTPINTLISLLLLGLLAWQLPSFLRWSVIEAVWQTDPALCQAAAGHGACWAVVRAKYRLILFGFYPYDQQWRPLLATGLLIGLLFYSSRRSCWNRWLALVWPFTLGLVFILMAGHLWGLTGVPTEQWGGLPLTLLLSVSAIATAFPLGVILALGRRSPNARISQFCVLYIELIRGIPLISVLFMTSFLLPIVMPEGTSIDVLFRVFIGLSLFAGAYLAEVVRGGLQSVRQGQIEAAQSLGLTALSIQTNIVLPQALTVAIPGLVNSFIGIFKDTSLVTIVSLYELTGTLGMALNSDALWRPFKLEGYIFIAIIYFIGCYAMSAYSLKIEAQLKHTH